LTRVVGVAILIALALVLFLKELWIR